MPTMLTTRSWPGETRRRLTEALQRPAAQQPGWADPGAADDVREALERLPPLVLPAEVDRLRSRLADAARGRAFVLQGGDCAETFAANTADHVGANVGALRAMARALEQDGGRPVVTLGRIAGQYAKPRSQPVDVLGLPVFRGDIVNGPEPDPAGRAADPRRMLRAYTHALAALNLIRAGHGGPGAEVFTSHEALLLDYERGLLRLAAGDGTGRGGETGGLYALSAHFLWIGERTRQLDGAHVALAALLANPVGVKIGPGTDPELAVAYAERLNPGREPGRLTFISRMGAGAVREKLPAVVERVTAAGHPVVWSCDPMHGNTREAPSGYKTRRVTDIEDEVRGFFEVHRELGTHPGGLHIELTGDAVTECLDEPGGIDDTALAGRYETHCDPRLNGDQALRLAGAVAALTRT